MFVATALAQKKDGVIDDLTNIMNTTRSEQPDIFGSQLQRSIKIDEETDKNSDQENDVQAAIFLSQPYYPNPNQYLDFTRLESVSNTSLLNELGGFIDELQEDISLLFHDADILNINDDLEGEFNRSLVDSMLDSIIDQGMGILSEVTSKENSQLDLLDFDRNEVESEFSLDEIEIINIDHQIKDNSASVKIHVKEEQIDNLSNIIRESDLSQDLVSWVVKNYEGGFKEVTLDLHPLDLGKLRLTIEQDADQGLHISIITESPNIQKLFDQNQHLLRQSMEEQGLSFGGFESSLFENSSQEQQNSKKEYPWLFESQDPEKDTSTKTKIMKGFRAQV